MDERSALFVFADGRTASVVMWIDEFPLTLSLPFLEDTPMGPDGEAHFERRGSKRSRCVIYEQTEETRHDARQEDISHVV